ALHEPAAPRVVTCLFGTVVNGRLVQRSTAAKAARGSMMRWCAESNVRRVADLLAFDVAGYAYDKERSSCDCLVFVRW
ncbi:MAG: peroxide stress protein YaaA, partial [Gordonibacter sp.]|uniref:peroxide stress protein YaaA n=1 Tax=Gordonibacter sp. TaxID=1968902 RepID=UPI002FC77E96